MEQTKTQVQQNTDIGRNLAFDAMNILACLAVIALHHNGMVHSYVPGAAWVQSLVAECVFYCAVPIFLMISGANLLGYRERYDTLTFFRRRVVHVVIPWFAWSLIFLFWRLGTGQLEAISLRDAVSMIINYRVLNVYWFFGALFASYLAMPVFSLLLKERRLLWYIVLLNFFFVSCLPILHNWLHFSWSMEIPLVGGYLIYILLGYLLSTEPLSRRQRGWLYALGLAGLLFRYGYTYHYSLLRGVTDTSIKGYRYFHAVLYSAAVFVWLSRLPWEKLPAWIKERLPLLSSCSFGVFLIHRVVMDYEMSLLHMDNQQLAWRTLCIPLTYLLSLLIVLLIKKIPVLRRIVG